jgi:quercetin dioxygenase-like cupin family protein
MAAEMGEPVLGRFALDEEIERFRPAADAAGRRAETLVKADRLRVVLVTMRTGAALAEHTAPGPITLQGLRGRFAIDVGTGEREVAAGDLLALAAGVPHAVRALAAGAFLLTIGWPADGPNRAATAAATTSTTRRTEP